MVNINKLRQMEKAKKGQKAVAAPQPKAEVTTQPSQQENAAPVILHQKPLPAQAAVTKTESKSPALSPVDDIASTSKVVPISAVERQGGAPEEKKTPVVETVATAPEETKELITFRLDDRLFGIFVDKVHSVVKPTFITRLPHVEDYLIGIMNLRGIITPIYDLKCRFGIGHAELTNQSRILILELDDNLVGFIVDAIATLHNIKSSAIQATPDIALGINQKYLKGVVTLPETEDLILVLALEEIVRMKGKVKISVAN